MASKLDLVLIAGSIAAVMGWIEHGHSVVIDSPDSIELASPMRSCTENESVRYSMSQVAFVGDGFPSEPIEQANPSESRTETCERN
jgi:hypothetical protein